MIAVNAPPTARYLSREKPNNPKQQGRKTPSRQERNTNNITHIPQINCSPKRMPRKEPTLRMESPLPEELVGCQGVILRGGYSRIYLDNGETVKCSTKFLIQKICAKGYLIHWHPNSSRLMSEDNG